jgi:trehalose synthase
MGADLQPLAVAPRSAGDHAPAAGAEAVERLRAAAEPLEGARVLHVSSAGGGGRVPDMLGSLLALAAGLGLQVEWRVLFGDAELQAGVRALHDGLQGAEAALDDAAYEAYLQACAGAARGLDGYDAVVLHDPGALGLAPALDAPLVWRCHVDASQPDEPALERAAGLAELAAVTIASEESFVHERLRGGEVHVAAPGIDPLHARNLELQPRISGRILRPLGIDLERPLCCQLMRMDRWKDPHATVEAFALAKQELPQLQLVLAGALDSSDTDEWRAAKEVSDYTRGRDDVYLLTSYERLGDLELGALQRLSRVALQRSLNEGFGLAASEALWKGTPVVGGAEGGVPLQVRDGVDGYIAEGGEQTAARLVELVSDPGLAVEMGRAGRERVRERFLVTHTLERELRALASAVGAGSVSS